MANPLHSLLSRSWALWLSVGFLFLLGLGAVGCQKDATAPTVDPDAVATVKVGTSATLGPYLTDAAGNALYFLARDVDGANTCASAACLPMWPVYYDATLKVPTALRAEDFATKTTADGRLQTTYKGWPLYYYAPTTNGTNTREAPGLTGGNGVGGVWHVFNPGYGVVLASKLVEDKTTHVVANKTYLTDARGRTLYVFAKDQASPATQATNCTGGCATVWPAAYLNAPAAPSTLRAADFGTLTRDQAPTTGPYGTTTGTREQLTYKGRPLYYYAGDNAARGRIEGHHLLESGDYWYVAAP